MGKGSMHNIWELTSLCHILSVESDSLGPAHTQAEGFTQRHKNRRLGSLDVILEAAYQGGHRV